MQNVMDLPSYHQCNHCGLVLGRDRVPLEEYRRKHLTYMSLVICTVCQAKGISLDDNPMVKQAVPMVKHIEPPSMAQEIMEHKKVCEQQLHELYRVLAEEADA